MIPVVASAVAPLIVGAIAVAGFSVFRSFAPVDMEGAYNFFSSCWTCGIFSGIVNAFSSMLNVVYLSLGEFMIYIMILVTAVWIAYKILKSFIVAKPVQSGWEYVNKFAPHMVKMVFIAGILLLPMPKLLISTFVEPVVYVAMSYNKAVDSHFSPEETKNVYSECLIATIIQDNQNKPDPNDAFSPMFRASLACQLASIHRLAGTGLTVGWTFMNEAFNLKHFYKVLFLPVFPNLGLFFLGFLLIAAFLVVLLPVPLYILEVVISLAIDFIFLPLIFLGWLFNGNTFFVGDKRNLKTIIEDFIKGFAGIAMLLIFVSFAMFFLDSILSPDNVSVSFIQQAIETNNPDVLVDGLTMKNGSFFTLLFSGVFLAMFMFGMVKLVKTLFSGVSIPEKYLNVTKDNVKYMANVGKSVYKLFSKKKDS